MSIKIKAHLPFIILSLVLVVYLGLKTLPENGWGGWCGGECDAQTLLSAKHWAKDGFIQNKFLFIPIGYSKIVQYLDNPEMRQHARGTTTGGLIGKRLYYTHYPAGYLLPYAFLMKLGVTERHWFRLLALFFSLIALILMYWFFNLILALRSPMLQGEGGSTPLIAFVATLYYGISTMFLDYADSLANQPIDDLFRFAILVLSVLAIQKAVKHSDSRRILEEASSAKAVPPSREIAPSLPSFWMTIVIWLLYFFLSLSSYDSTFFILIWLVGLDLITYQKFLWKRWLFFASAPILAFVLQLLQNYWYFGNWREVWLDILGASMAKAYTSNIFSHFVNIFYPFFLMTSLKEFWSSISIFVLFAILRRLKYLNNIIQILIILFLAGGVYPFIFISAGRFSYQGRQMMPLIALLIGSATIFIIRVFKNESPRQNFWHKNKEKNYILLFGVLIATVIFLWGGQIYRTVQYIYDWPNNKANSYAIQLGKSLRPLASNDSLIFYRGDKLSVDFTTEYYFDMPILFFKKEEDLVKDFLWLRKNSQYSFGAIVMTDYKKNSNNLRQLLLEQKISKIEDIQFIQDEYVFRVMP